MLDRCFLAESVNINDLADEAEDVKILRSSEDVLAGRVLSNSCTTCKVRRSCYSHYYQDSYTGTGPGDVCRSAHLEKEDEICCKDLTATCSTFGAARLAW